MKNAQKYQKLQLKLKGDTRKEKNCFDLKSYLILVNKIQCLLHMSLFLQTSLAAEIYLAEGLDFKISCTVNVE
jgi:hypothetical protein